MVLLGFLFQTKKSGLYICKISSTLERTLEVTFFKLFFVVLPNMIIVRLYSPVLLTNLARPGLENQVLTHFLSRQETWNTLNIGDSLFPHAFKVPSPEYKRSIFSKQHTLKQWSQINHRSNLSNQFEVSARIFASLFTDKHMHWML